MYFSATIKSLLIIAGILLLGFLVWYIKVVVVYFLVSAVVSVIGQRLISLLRYPQIKGYHLPRALCAAISLVFIWTAIFSFFSVFIPLVSQQAKELSQVDISVVINNFKSTILYVQNTAAEYYPRINEISLTEIIIRKITPYMNISLITGFFTYFASMLGDIFIAIFSISFISFFLMKEERLLHDIIITLIPEKYEEKTLRAVKSIHNLLGRYFIGIILEVSLIILLVSIGLWIIEIKFEHILLIALFVGILNVIPYIGPIIGAFFGFFIAIITHLDTAPPDLFALLGFMALVFTIVQIIDNVLFQPLIYSNSVNAHPLEVFLVILIAGNFVGIAGMILAIPTYTILRVIGKEFFSHFRVVKKLTANM